MRHFFLIIVILLVLFARCEDKDESSPEDRAILCLASVLLCEDEPEEQKGTCRANRALLFCIEGGTL